MQRLQSIAIVPFALDLKGLLPGTGNKQRLVYFGCDWAIAAAVTRDFAQDLRDPAFAVQSFVRRILGPCRQLQNERKLGAGLLGVPDLRCLQRNWEQGGNVKVEQCRFTAAAAAAALIALQFDPVVRSSSAIGSLVAVMAAEEA
jgi:hypothetical protein